ncbi:MAG: carboxylesterase family protein [Microbacterium sp.]|uniref:carboxylesterase/lipase family protein n=1 Tax=Microbacterium sp. TaxID=51671 RepID=UPI0039E59B64
MNDAVCRTAAGAVRGVWRGAPGRPGASAAFLGIPFARPPVGPLRFAAPAPVEPWEGVRDAVAYGATPQRWMSPGPTLIPEPSVPGESTLNVNVFTPRPGDESAALPVLVFIHGGGYVSGSPASPWYDGRAFNRDGVVTVTVSYRLGFDGFGWIDGAPQNRGVLDWIAALEWVRDNIAAFGGDPGNVTIAGQSAGGGAVLRLLALPAAQGLFRRALSSSGAVADIPAERARETSRRLAARLGVAPTRDGFATAAEKQIEKLQVPAAASGAKGIAAARAALLAPVPYGPVLDGDTVQHPTVESLAAGVGADKALVLGSNDDEFTGVTRAYRDRLRFVPPALALALVGEGAHARAYVRANRGLGDTAAVLGRFVTDHVFRSLVMRVAAARGAAPTWAYRFAWRSPVRGDMALHCLDVPFWFDCLGDEHVAGIAGDSPPQSLADHMHAAAVAFARDGDPGWPAWSVRPGLTRVFGAPPSTPVLLPDGYASVRALV